MKKLKIIFTVLVTIPLIIIFAQNSKSQSIYEFQSGGIKGEVDTLGIQKAETITKESLGLLEKEVDPDTYIVGPGDIFEISIVTSKPQNYNVSITPEGKIIIPSVGIVSVKSKTLSEVLKLIEQEIRKVYKTESIFASLKDIRKFKVIISGSVLRTGIIPATPMERVSEVIDAAGGFRGNASWRKIQLIREGLTEPINVDLIKFFLTGDKNANPFVQGGDQIIVPPANYKIVIKVLGEVPSPGTFEYNEGDSLSTLLKFGMGFLISSYLDSVEVVRFISNSSDIEKSYINLSSWPMNFIKTSNLKNDFPLKPGDRVFIRNIPEWLEGKSVVIRGEVKYPGRYAINEETTRLRDIIDRAGGFTADASLENSIFLRQSEMKKEDKEMERLYKTPLSEMTESELRYFQVRSRERRGLMSINFKKIIAYDNTEDNILLRDDDSIFIPMKTYMVNIQGRVNNPGLVIYKPDYSFEDYIALAGGYGFRADESEANIIKSKGQLFLAKNKNFKIEPGDNILVPPEKESKFIDIFTTGLTITMQLITITGVVLALVKLK